MFINNKYTRWYFKIIDVAKKSVIEGYTEKHHVTPRSLGGTNERENIVALTARQHFVCHLLLVKMTTGLAQQKMIAAARHMSVCHRKQRYEVTSITYERLKQRASEMMKGNKRGAGSGGWHHTMKTRRKMSRNRKGVVPKGLSELQRKRWSGEGNPRAGTTFAIASQIREYRLIHPTEPITSICLRFGVSYKTAYGIIKGSSYLR